MWKKKIMPYLFVLAGLFVCLNIFLLIYHQESIHNRKAYIGEWSSIPLHDLRETASTEGVYKAAEETTVFMDSSLGTYLQTLVEENAEVEENEPLIEYQLRNLEETQRELQAQLDEVTAEISAVETTLAQLQTTDIPEEEPASPPFEEEENLPEEEADSATYLREQFRLETERELASLQAREARLEEELNQLTEEQSQQILSPVNGTVKNIDEQDGNPVITISSHDLVIEGKLSETERKNTETGMNVKISGLTSDGTISELAEFPETASGQESEYLFQVSIEDEEEQSTDDILTGYHTTMEIILSERLNVPAIHEDQLTKTLTPAIWILEENGTVSYRQLETGIKDGRWTEVVNGAEAGQFVAESTGNLANGAMFVTPLETRFIDWNNLNEGESALLQRYPLLAGLLHR